MPELTMITEQELFASLIANENSDEDLIKKNIKLFLRKVPNNIFRNEYYVIYEALKASMKYDVIINFNQFNQILLNNIERLIESKNIDKEEFSDGDTDDIQRIKEKFIYVSCNKYKELSEMPKSKGFIFDLDIYLKWYVNEEYKNLLQNVYKITTEGMYIRGKFIQGVEEANKYYAKVSSELNLLLNYDERKMDSILVSTEGYNDYNDRAEKRANEDIAGTCIDEIDSMLGKFRKGDVVLVLGPTGGGKTRFSVNICHEALLNGKNGVFFTLEDTPDKVMSFFLARHIVKLSDTDDKYLDLGITSDEIFKKSYDSDKKELVQAATLDLFNNKNYGKMMIIPAPLYDDEIEGALEEVWDNEFEFDWVVIDYTSLIRSRRFDNIRDMLTDLMPKLETLAQSFKNKGFLLILPHQLKVETIKDFKKGENNTLIGSADSSAVMKSAHIALTVYTDDEMKKHRKAKIISTKTRDIEGFGEITVGADLGTCNFRSLDLDGGNDYD